MQSTVYASGKQISNTNCLLFIEIVMRTTHQYQELDHRNIKYHGNSNSSKSENSVLNHFKLLRIDQAQVDYFLDLSLCIVELGNR